MRPITIKSQKVCIDCSCSIPSYSSLIFAGREKEENLIIEEINLDTTTRNFLYHSLNDKDGISLLQTLSPRNQKKILELALNHNKTWATGRKLNVKFIDGSPFLRKKVEHFAHKWSNFANITFDFNQAENAEIRISFSGIGSWSYIGTDALSISDKNTPTMNFGWFDKDTHDLEFQRTVVHEFGHALGCIHEHQSPAVGINWDRNYVYRYYKHSQGWSKQKVDENIFKKYTKSSITNSAYDSKSIMHYPIPSSFTTDGFEVGWNNLLSVTDTSFIKKQYP